MSPPTLPPPNPKVLAPLSLAQSSYRLYGDAITSPIPPTLNDAPAAVSSIPAHGNGNKPVLANQGSAIKYSPISTMQNSYGTGKSKLPGSPRMSQFSSFPRNLRSAGKESAVSKLFDVRILERHPYTSQTFIPLSYGKPEELLDGPKTRAGEDDTCYLVITAPTLVGQTAAATVPSPSGDVGRETVIVHDPPDLENMQAFLARPGQAVTYAAGTWHAPMVVLGRRRVDFVVMQFMNGIADEDCQEVQFPSGIAVGIGGEIAKEGGAARAKL